VIVAAITTSRRRAEMDSPLASWKEARLLFPSVVKPGKIVTIHRALIRKSLGHISQEDMERVGERLASLLELI